MSATYFKGQKLACHCIAGNCIVHTIFCHTATSMVSVLLCFAIEIIRGGNSWLQTGGLLSKCLVGVLLDLGEASQITKMGPQV